MMLIFIKLMDKYKYLLHFIIYYFILNTYAIGTTILHNITITQMYDLYVYILYVSDIDLLRFLNLYSIIATIIT